VSTFAEHIRGRPAHSAWPRSETRQQKSNTSTGQAPLTRQARTSEHDKRAGAWHGGCGRAAQRSSSRCSRRDRRRMPRAPRSQRPLFRWFSRGLSSTSGAQGPLAIGVAARKDGANTPGTNERGRVTRCATVSSYRAPSLAGADLEASDPHEAKEVRRRRGRLYRCRVANGRALVPARGEGAPQRRRDAAAAT
jgi:hypothetical protein